MAVTQCKKCSLEVSARAKVCPGCGASNPGVKAQDVIGGVFLLAIAVWLLSKCSTGTEAEPPKTIQDISKNISAVQNENGVLRITFAGRAVLRSKDVMQNTSMNAHDVSEKLVRYFPAELGEQVTFVANAETSDQYGKAAIKPVLELQYDVADLKKIDYGNLYHKQMLNLAGPLKYLSLAGAQIVKEWCGDDDNRLDAARFCERNTAGYFRR